MLILFTSSLPRVFDDAIILSLSGTDAFYYT